MADIFISYSQKDRTIATGLAAELESRVWFEVPPHLSALATTLYGDLAPPAPRCATSP